ncbi:MAG: antitoxin VapB family protein [Candidatus Micrarchaeaceae archaeon]
MARQISVSDEVYRMLYKVKGRRSFSEVIKDAFSSRSKGNDIMRFAGIFNGDKEWEAIKKQIAKDRESNYGREFKKW